MAECEIHEPGCMERRMLYKVFRYIAKIDNQVERASMATSLLGRYGVDPTVQENIEEIRQYVLKEKE